MPQFNLGLNGIDDVSLNSDQKQFKDRLVKSIQRLAGIEKDIREGQCGDAVKECRDAIEPLKKDSQQFIRDMLMKATGIEEKMQLS